MEETQGAILTFMHVPEQDLVTYAIRYGADVVELVNEFGTQMIDAIRQTSGGIIPYARTYGSAILQLLNQPEGSAIIELIPVFDESIIEYTLQYPNDFPGYLLQYGRDAIKAFESYDEELLLLGRAERDGPERPRRDPEPWSDSLKGVHGPNDRGLQPRPALVAHPGHPRGHAARHTHLRQPFIPDKCQIP